MQPLRILHIATHTGVFRGGAVQACRMAEGLARRGHEVTLLAAEDRKSSPAEREEHARSWAPLRSRGVKVESMPYGGLFGHLKLRRFLDRGRYDVIHAHRDDALIASVRAVGRKSKPALVAQRGTVRQPPKPATAAFESPQVRAVVCVAEAVRNSLLQFTQVAPEKVQVVYGSVDLEKFAPREPDAQAVKTAGFPEDAYVVGSLSAYRRAKGFDDLLPALNRAMKQAPEMRAVFLGNRVAEKIGPEAAKTEFGSRFRFVGHQADVPAWLSTMDVTVMAATSREGLSGVLRESLAMGVPVISTDCAGNREIVRDRETGLLAPVGDPAALGESILYARNHPEEMRAMAERGRAWVREHCSMEAQCSALERIYRSVLD